MNSDPKGCQITQHGSSGGYTYDFSGRPSGTGTEADWSNRPVNYVGWGDAVRFANWLNNGQPGLNSPVLQDANSTEDGSYFLNGATSNDDLQAVTARNANAIWVIPNPSEWSKAARHKNDGDTGNYFTYQTSSSTEPSNALVDPDPGNNATFQDEFDAYTIGSPYWRTEVRAHENSPSPYGTFDMGGNVWEWNEDRVEYDPGFEMWGRGLYGGGFRHFIDYEDELLFRYWFPPTQESSLSGFRVLAIPEPATMAIFALGGLAVLRRRRK